jgi:hypothetical protein
LESGALRDTYHDLMSQGRQDERASLPGLTPEEALRALLAVDPDEKPDDGVEDTGEAEDR